MYGILRDKQLSLWVEHAYKYTFSVIASARARRAATPECGRLPTDNTLYMGKQITFLSKTLYYQLYTNTLRLIFAYYDIPEKSFGINVTVRPRDDRRACEFVPSLSKETYSIEDFTKKIYNSLLKLRNG